MGMTKTAEMLLDKIVLDAEKGESGEWDFSRLPMSDLMTLQHWTHMMTKNPGVDESGHTVYWQANLKITKTLAHQAKLRLRG